MEEKKLKDNVLHIYNIVDYSEEKPDVNIFENEVAKAIIEYKEIKYPTEDYYSVLQMKQKNKRKTTKLIIQKQQWNFIRKIFKL